MSLLFDGFLFLAGTALGSIPSVATYIACKRGIYADLVEQRLSNQPSKAIMIEAEDRFVARNAIRLENHHETQTHKLLNLMIKNISEYPDKWTFYSEAIPWRSSDLRQFKGFMNKEDSSIRLIGSIGTTKATEEAWLGSARITMKEFDKAFNAIYKERGLKDVKRMLGKLNPPPTGGSGVTPRVEQDKFIKKMEASNDGLVDPFAETYNDHIYTIGKSIHCMEALSRKQCTTPKPTYTSYITSGTSATF